MTTNQKIKEIAHHYGYSRQKQIAIEEMAELTKAILKFDRTSQANEEEFRSRFQDIIEEIADVSIMVEQLTELTSRDAVEQKINEKLNRQLARIEEEEKLV